MLTPCGAFAPALCAYTAELMPIKNKIRALLVALRLAQVHSDFIRVWYEAAAAAACSSPCVSLQTDLDRKHWPFAVPQQCYRITQQLLSGGWPTVP